MWYQVNKSCNRFIVHRRSLKAEQEHNLSCEQQGCSSKLHVMVKCSCLSDEFDRSVRNSKGTRDQDKIRTCQTIYSTLKAHPRTKRGISHSPVSASSASLWFSSNKINLDAAVAGKLYSKAVRYPLIHSSRVLILHLLLHL